MMVEELAEALLAALRAVSIPARLEIVESILEQGYPWDAAVWGLATAHDDHLPVPVALLDEVRAIVPTTASDEFEVAEVQKYIAAIPAR